MQPPPQVGGDVGLTIAMWIRVTEDEDWMGLINLNNDEYEEPDQPIGAYATTADFDQSVDLRLNALVQSGFNTAPYSMFYSVVGDDGSLSCSGPCAAVQAPYRFPLNMWTHVAVIHDATDATIYWNGTVVASKPVPQNSLPRQLTRLHNQIGKTMWGTSFHGVLRDVLIFNRAITPAELRDVMDNVALPAGDAPVVSEVRTWCPMPPPSPPLPPPSPPRTPPKTPPSAPPLPPMLPPRVVGTQSTWGVVASAETPCSYASAPVFSPPVAAHVDSTIQFTACGVSGLPVIRKLPTADDPRSFRATLLHRRGRLLQPDAGTAVDGVQMSITWEGDGTYTVHLKPSSRGDFELKLEMVDSETGVAEQVRSHPAHRHSPCPCLCGIDVCRSRIVVSYGVCRSLSLSRSHQFALALRAPSSSRMARVSPALS